jgi:hypothetical protein
MYTCPVVHNTALLVQVVLVLCDGQQVLCLTGIGFYGLLQDTFQMPYRVSQVGTVASYSLQRRLVGQVVPPGLAAPPPSLREAGEGLSVWRDKEPDIPVIVGGRGYGLALSAVPAITTEVPPGNILPPGGAISAFVVPSSQGWHGTCG